MKYIKRPVEIEAVQLNACERDNDGEPIEFPLFSEQPEWLINAIEDGTIYTKKVHESDYVHLAINTLEGEMLVSPCDYIIRGVVGELYPCKPEIFMKTYVSAEEHLSS